MLLKLFKSNHPFVFVFIPFLAALIWLPGVIFGNHDFVTFDQLAISPLYNWLIGILNENFYWQKGIAFLLFVFQAYWIVRLNFKYIFIEQKTYLPAIIFVMVGSIFPYFQNLHPFLIANLFAIFAFDRCFEINKEKNLFNVYFEGGFILGLGALFYMQIGVLLMVVWLTQFILRTFNGREWFSSILGFLTPSFIYFLILFLTGNHLLFVNYIIDFTHNTPSDIQLFGLPLIVVSINIFLLGIAFLYGVSIVGARKISTRKYFFMAFWMLLIAILLKVTLPFVSTSIIYFVAFPASLIFTFFFMEIRNRWFAEVSFTILILAVLLGILMQLNVL